MKNNNSKTQVDKINPTLKQLGDDLVEVVSELFRKGLVDDLYDEGVQQVIDNCSEYLESRIWDDDNWFNQDPNNKNDFMSDKDDLGRPLDADSSPYDH